GLGTGLGLFVCRGLVDAMAGRMEIESAVGVGTTARVLLPASNG
ncbi:MAG: ATP-binding protein, partial [Myxococcaceae bacterium]